MKRAMLTIWTALALVFTLAGGARHAGPAAAEAVVATVEVGRGPIGVAANPATNRVYVANNADNTVSVLDGASNAPIATIQGIPLPINVALNPATNRVYVTAAGSRRGEEAVVVIDGASNVPIATIPVPVSSEGGGLTDVATNPPTNRVYVTTRDRFGGVDIVVIDGVTNAIVNRQRAGGATSVATNPVTNRVYVTLNNPRGGPTAGALLVLDGGGGVAREPVGLNSQPLDVAVNPQTGRVYVTTTEGVVVLDGATNAIVARVPIPPDADGTGPTSIAVNSATGRIYAIAGANVFVLEEAGNSVATTVPRRRRGFGNSQVAVNPATGRIYVTNSAVLRGPGTTVTVFQGDQPPAPPPPAGCDPAPLGAATPFNLFVLGDLTQRTTDAEGRVAAGGRASLTDYSVGAALGAAEAGDSLVVGGVLEYTRGRVEAGHAVSGDPGPVNNVTFAPGRGYAQGATLDFAAAGADLRARSAQLAALPLNGTTRLEYGGITLSGSDPRLNIFALSAADLGAAHTLTLEIPAGATALVNVRGEGGAVRGLGFALRGVERRRLLLHFPEATALRLENVGVEGSVLAPRAAVAFDNGVIHGQLIGASLTGTGQANHVPFGGCLPPSGPPTPPSAPALRTPLVGNLFLADLDSDQPAMTFSDQERVRLYSQPLSMSGIRHGV